MDKKQALGYASKHRKVSHLKILRNKLQDDSLDQREDVDNSERIEKLNKEIEELENEMEKLE